jgi:hypothetical protein
MVDSDGGHKKMKAAAIPEHNKFKVQVDQRDQLPAYYAFHQCQVKWWEKLSMHLVDWVLVNALILLEKHIQRK